ncbi:881_t:CDS:2, partial [Cetraspora pellucida]
LKGEHGQFFTPRNVVRFIINFLDVNETQKIIDPACGTGEKEEIEREKIAIARKNIFGCDKDSFLAQACKAYMCILGDEKYDIIITNPPFGKTIAVDDEKVLKNFTIVLPEGIFGNESGSYREIRDFLLENYSLLAIFSIPQETFEPFTGNKCSILILENKKYEEASKVIFANIQKIGHNKRGETLYRYNNSGIPLKDEEGNFVVNDELNDIFLEIKKNNVLHYKKSHKETKIFYVLAKEIKETPNLFLIPSYYNGFLKLINELKTKKNENSF